MKGIAAGLKPSISLMFLGGVGDDVTGSAALMAIDVNGETRYGLVDAGGYQGEGNRNYYFPVDAEKIDFVIITHAHYDHVGLLPKLFKDGFKGHIYITEQAKRQGNLIMQDSACINMENSECGRYGATRLNKTRKKYEKKKKKDLSCRDQRHLDNAISQVEDIIESPLYTTEDVSGLRFLYQTIKPYTLFEIYKDQFYIKLIPTTHQNGAVQIEVYVKGEDETLGLLFTGDLGSNNALLYENKDNFVNPEIDYGVIESLHGTADPVETIEESIEKLEKIIKDGVKKKKCIFISGFSLDRDSILVYLLKKMRKKGVRCKFYFDAPMAFRENAIYQEYYNRESEIRKLTKDEEVLKTLWFKDLGENPFGLEDFKVIKKRDEHIELLNSSGPFVVITSSANGNGGRVVDFFSRFIQNDKAVFVFPGWIYPESPSQILHEAEEGELIEMEGVRYIKRCETHRLHGFSSHGYLPDIFSKFYTYPKMKEVILNHGDMLSKEDVAEAIKKEFEVDSHIPKLYDAYTLTKEKITKLESYELMEIFKPVLLTFNMDNVLAEIDELNKPDEAED